MFDELGRAVVATAELVFVSEDDKRVATPKADTAHDEPAACMTRLPPPNPEEVERESASQTCRHGGTVLTLATTSPQAHVSAPDHKSDKTYVRTS